MLCAISMTVPPWLMITKHDNKIHSMPSLWLLPFVSTVVASALAGLIGPRMNTQFQEMYINIIGYILWGMGMMTAACVDRRPHPRGHIDADGVLHPRADGQARGDAQVLARLPPEADLVTHPID